MELSFGGEFRILPRMRAAKLLSDSDEIRSVISGSVLHYAVISVRGGPCCERLVIAYPDEKSLEGLIAAPSILGLGYRSREEAQANLNRRATTPRHLGRKLSAALVSITGPCIEFVANHQFPGGAANFASACCTIRDLLQRSWTLAIVALYSKSVLSAAVRALISF
jgi:hypothetical protein